MSICSSNCSRVIVLKCSEVAPACRLRCPRLFDRLFDRRLALLCSALVARLGLVARFILVRRRALPRLIV